jgi:hypothetical protein
MQIINITYGVQNVENHYVKLIGMITLLIMFANVEYMRWLLPKNSSNV